MEETDGDLCNFLDFFYSINAQNSRVEKKKKICGTDLYKIIFLHHKEGGWCKNQPPFV